MSHVSKIETAITDIGLLEQALRELGMEYRLAPAQSCLSLSGYGKNEVIDGCVMEIKTGCAYSIGIRPAESGYEAVADWWAVETFTGRVRGEILGAIMKQYAYKTIMDKVCGMGFELVSEEQDAREEVKIRVRRWSRA